MDLGIGADSILATALAHAGLRWCGKGLEQGAYLRPSRLRVRQLKRTGHPSEAATLQATMAGAVWPQERKWEAELIDATQRACPRCGHPTEDMMQRAWRCATNHGHGPYEESKHLVDRAEREPADWPAFLASGRPALGYASSLAT